MSKKKIIWTALTVGVILFSSQLSPEYETHALPKTENLNIKVSQVGHFERIDSQNMSETEKQLIFDKFSQQMEEEQQTMMILKNAKIESERKAEEEKEHERRKWIESFGGNSDFVGSLPERALQEAMTQIGKPYYWGAEGKEDYDQDGDVRDGYDCSGLIVWAYHRQGKTDLPRTTKGQWNKGEKVRKENVQPGDLIYFLNNRKNKQVDHVGIYIGEGKMLHAPEPGRFVEIKKVSWKNMVSIRRHN